MKLLRPGSRYHSHNHTIKSCLRQLLLFLILLSPAVQAASEEGGSESIENGKTNYFTLEPAFVVNVLDGTNIRFMQVQLDVVSEDSAAIEALQDHHAPIRNNLLLLLADRNISEVLGLQQREKLRQEALHEIQKTLLKYADIKSDSSAKDGDGHKYPTGVQDVLFTSFVIQ
jgi:flagellar FliL protein